MFAALLAAGCGGEADGCADWPTGLPPQVIAVVVDATDGLSGAQRADIWSRVRGVAENASAGSVFHLFEVRSEAPGGVREAAQIRRPPHPCEVSHWSDNPDQRAAQWAPLYLRPLRDALGSMSRAGPSDSSAILQGVQSAARRFVDSEAGRGHLILISDLMQNVGVDFYRGIPEFEQFRATSLYREVRSRGLNGAQLTVLQLPPSRDGLVNEVALQRFWTAFFTDQGAADADAAFFPVEGARSSD